MKGKICSIWILNMACVFSVMGQHDVKAKKDSFLLLEPVEVKSSRTNEKSPFTHSNINRKEIARLNLGQDIPFILNHQPSVVIHSDAGNGIGYTGLRIRGTDASRINVTLNGIPFNDAESQGTFFVDLPDFASSIGSIQIQRGVGTSSNGAGAFGATISLSTNEINAVPYAEFNNSFGSFNTWKHTIKTGSGLIGDRFTTDFRLSRITSDGYIDRASSDLHSYYFSTAYINKGTYLRFNHFSGKEKTYQAWYGVSQADLKTNRTVNYAGTEKADEPYDNETDNYKQDHYQLFFTSEITKKLNFSTALFYVKGKGYYEQYKSEQAYADYGFTAPTMGNTVITHTDLIRQLWLDNDFYGNIFSFLYNGEIVKLTLGGGLNKYKGDHFGEVIWAEKGISPPARWYDNDASKKDLNIYFKQQTAIGNSFNFFYDLQLRHVRYIINGFRNNPSLHLGNRYDFFNPKFGLNYSAGNWRIYASYARAQKEPNRDDYETGNAQTPRAEKLDDIEAGIENNSGKFSIGSVFYFMNYKDQLVLTGLINDVGAYTRTNIPRSYRMGVEFTLFNKFSEYMNASMNIAFSKNKIRHITEYIDDYDNGGQKKFLHTSPDISFSPSVVANASVNIIPFKNLEISFSGKYVGKQYLDNTQNEQRKLDPYYSQDARSIYFFNRGKLREASLILQVNNIFNTFYEPNGYTYSYYYGGEVVTQNFYYPMAGRNFMLGFNIRF